MALADTRGIALVSTLCIMLLGLGMMLTVFYAVAQTIKTGLAQARYTAALDAAKGGVEFMTMMIQEALTNPATLASDNNTIGPSTPACLQQKYENVTSQTDWSSCTPFANATNPDPTVAPADLIVTFPLSGFRIYVKIVDTRLQGSPSQGYHYFYTIVARAQSLTGNERAEVTALYSLEQ